MGQYTIKDVQNRAELLKEDTDNIYRAIYTKTGNSLETLDQVPGSIMSIPEPPNEEPLTITPSADRQEFYADEGIRYNPITVEPVTSAIDSNIQPENIKEGVSILGVAGTLSGGSAEDYIDFSITQSITENGEFPLELKTNGKYAGSIYVDVPTTGSGSAEDYINFSAVESFNENGEFPLTLMANGKYAGNVSINVPTSNVFVVPPEMGFGGSKFTEFPSNWDFSEFNNATDMSYIFTNCAELTVVPPIDTSKATNVSYLFNKCASLTTIPQLNFSSVINASYLFNSCTNLTNLPPLNTANMTSATNVFYNCPKLTTVEGIDFSGFTSNVIVLFGYTSNMPNLTHFIVNGKINVSISDNYSIKPLTAIDYDSVKSILAAADRTDNTNAKTLAFNRTIADQNGELAALVASCSTKGWTITGLTLQ